MSVAENTLPRWDVTNIYPNLRSPEFERDFQSVASAIGDLTELFDSYQIEERELILVDEASTRAFETVYVPYAEVIELTGILDAYIYSFVATDSRDELAQAKTSELEQQSADLEQLSTRLTAWVGSLDDVEELMAKSAIARRHAHWLKRATIEATHLMSPAEEELAIELGLTGGSAWAKLYDTITSQLMVQLEIDGKVRDVPFADVGNMAYSTDRDVRRRAHEAKIRTWETAAVPLAAALNSIKGQVNTLNDHRGWDSALDSALFQNRIDRESLDAMLAAVRESLPDFRRYLRTKARALGLPVLAWYDMYAPVAGDCREWSFETACNLILVQFATYSEKLRYLAERAFQERWIDAEPREGKEDGAFCLSLRGDESRILTNYVPSYNAMDTLAHELGHAYHYAALATRPVLLRSTPNTLAETASIFCQTIIREAALMEAEASQQVLILEAFLQEACLTVVDVHVGFRFEQQLFERRRERELSIDELKRLTVDTYRDAYGVVVEETTLHPYVWAAESLFYRVDDSFYNFPYTFGLLFALGLYARYRHDPETFKPDYDELLASTGEADAATLCARFGIDIRQPAFWRESLDIIRKDIDRFEALVGAGASPNNGKPAGS